MTNNFLYENLTYKIIGACMEVHNILGKGFNEVVYADALEIEFQKQQILYQREVMYKIDYKGVPIKHKYFADFVIENKIILDLKAINNLDSSHQKQVLNYLVISKLNLGLLINFGSDKLEYKRIIL